MRRTLVLAAGLVAVAAAAVAPLRGAHAQAIPNITAAKRVANGAASAANAHTAAVDGAAGDAAARPAPANAQRAPERAKPAAGTRPASKPGATKPAATKPAAPAATARRDTAGKAVDKGTDKSASTSVATRGAAGEMTFLREVYSYPGAGRRDPFLSLLKSGDLRPLLSDLKLVTVLYDPTGRNSVAILRDLSTKDQYRVKVGQQIGRMRVAQIQPKQLVLTIEEFGYSRQETLGLNSDTTSARTR